MVFMTKNKKKSVLFVSFEAAPFLKTGGLGDVAGALPKALYEEGIDARLIMPKYSVLDEKKYHLRPLAKGLRVPTPWGEHRMNLWATRMPGSRAIAYFIDYPPFFHRKNLFGYRDDERRFAFFSRAVITALRSLDFYPDVVHANDWQTGLLALDLVKESQEDPLFCNVATVFTIHNMAYQGSTDKRLIRYSGLRLSDAPSIRQDLSDGDIDMLYEGIANSTVVSTVSPTYAKEILTKEYGFGMEKLLRLRARQKRLFGILNGIDTKVFNPSTDSALHKKFSAKNCTNGKQYNKKKLQQELGLEESELPLFVVVSRLAEQKGFDILVPAVEKILKANKMQLAVLGTGDGKIEKSLARLSASYKKQCKVVLGFDNALANRMYAAADFFLMPSRFEPCGLSQLISFRYGTLVVARKTGGLADTVVDLREKSGNGFVFRAFSPAELSKSIQLAIEFYPQKKAFTQAQIRAMRQDFSWGRSAREYKKLYHTAIRFHKKDLKK
jgi:starch synthase